MCLECTVSLLCSSFELNVTVTAKKLARADCTVNDVSEE